MMTDIAPILELLQDHELRACLEFILKIDALKKVLRKTSVIKIHRQENTAEHSWHLIMMALVLQRYSNAPLKTDRVIKMLALHDLGEIETGDVHLYDAKRQQNTHSEQEAVEALFASLPDDIKDEFTLLWKEFAEGKTPEAKFARAIDRFQPFLSNLANDGGSWKTLAVTREQALIKNQHIAEGSQKLWETYQRLSQKMDEMGYFHQESN